MKIKNILIMDVILSEKLRNRFYNITDTVQILVTTEKHGQWLFHVQPGFDTDGRSGGVLVDPIFPNWGTQAERTAVIIHDILFHDFRDVYPELTFEFANDMLCALVKYIGKWAITANLIWAGVSTPMGRRAFGHNTPAEDRNKRLATITRMDTYAKSSLV
jgi:hypothetical protein